MILLLEMRIPIVLYYLLDVQFIRNDHLQNFSSNYRVRGYEDRQDIISRYFFKVPDNQ